MLEHGMDWTRTSDSTYQRGCSKRSSWHWTAWAKGRLMVQAEGQTLLQAAHDGSVVIWHRRCQPSCAIAWARFTACIQWQSTHQYLISCTGDTCWRSLEALTSGLGVGLVMISMLESILGLQSLSSLEKHFLVQVLTSSLSFCNSETLPRSGLVSLLHDEHLCFLQSLVLWSDDA